MLPRGPILCVTSPALDSNDSSDKYSNFAVAGAGHVTVFIYIYTNFKGAKWTRWGGGGQKMKNV